MILVDLPIEVMKVRLGQRLMGRVVLSDGTKITITPQDFPDRLLNRCPSKNAAGHPCDKFEGHTGICENKDEGVAWLTLRTNGA